MSLHLSLLLVLFSCASYLPMAQGTERSADATYAYELDQYASAVTGLEWEFLSLIERASGEERLNLYKTYNQLMGTWVQVDFLQTLLDASVAAASEFEEEAITTALRDQAQFAVWQLDHTITDLEQNSSEVKRLSELQTNELLRSLLSAVRTTIGRFLVDQCARAPCTAGP